jgi:rod shape-determining protein MreB
MFREIIDNLALQMGMDLGSCNTLIYLKDRGVVVEEPSVIARIKKKRWQKEGRLLAVGARAKEMAEKEPRSVEVVWPIRGGLVDDYQAMVAMMEKYLKLVYEVPVRGVAVLRPSVVVAVPGLMTDVQLRAVTAILTGLGVGRVVLVNAAVVAGIGSGTLSDRFSGVVVDVGGGKTAVSVVSSGGVIVERNIETGGNSIDEAIVSFVKMKHGMLIGRVTAEKIKLRLDNMVIRGRDLESGLPKSVMIGVAETSEAIALELTKIVRTLRSVLDEAPPEITNEVVKQGILLVGRGALTKGLKMMIETETRINCLPVDDGPGMAVIKGLAMLVEDKDLRERVKLVSGYGS